MGFLMEKEKFTFQMDVFSKGLLTKVKPKVKIIYLFMRMDLFIVDLLRIQKRMVLGNFIFIIVFNIQDYGKMEYLMVMELKFILMVVNTLDLF
jgi:hypothetical protein